MQRCVWTAFIRAPRTGGGSMLHSVSISTLCCWWRGEFNNCRHVNRHNGGFRMNSFTVRLQIPVWKVSVSLWKQARRFWTKRPVLRTPWFIKDKNWHTNYSGDDRNPICRSLLHLYMFNNLVVNCGSIKKALSALFYTLFDFIISVAAFSFVTIFCHNSSFNIFWSNECE